MRSHSRKYYQNRLKKQMSLKGGWWVPVIMQKKTTSKLGRTIMSIFADWTQPRRFFSNEKKEKTT